MKEPKNLKERKTLNPKPCQNRTYGKNVRLLVTVWIEQLLQLLLLVAVAYTAICMRATDSTWQKALVEIKTFASNVRLTCCSSRPTRTGFRYRC